MNLHMTKLFIIISILLRVPTCSTWDLDKRFEDGTDLSVTQEYRDYRSNLEAFLTITDSMFFGKYPILPPNSDESNYIQYRDISEFESQILVKTDDQTITFTSSGDPDVMIQYEFKAFDSKNRTVYMIQKQEHFISRVFGISLDTGNQFTVYEDSPAGMYDEMYSWKFSPNFDYLLKVGDIGNDNYGWSIVNVKTGVEGLDTYVRYQEFIFDVKWIDSETFTYTYLQIPFKDGQIYDKDYRLFYALMNREAFPEVTLAGSYLYPVVYTADVKGRILSNRTHELNYR